MSFVINALREYNNPPAIDHCLPGVVAASRCEAATESKDPYTTRASSDNRVELVSQMRLLGREFGLQGLKSAFLVSLSATAEAVPFPKLIYQISFALTMLPTLGELF